jgi:hypothetical protein
MTSTLSIGPDQQRLEGRTVRDIVEHDPSQVNEIWCRKIFRQLLQSLERQYGMQMPHRAITPDTVVFHDNGEPLLVASDLSASEPTEAADLNALARVVHFAITSELIPEGPLAGRGLPGYSESLVSAVDRCMAPDPAQRPQTIAELRDILGIVPLGPVPAAALPPDETAPVAEVPVAATPAAAASATAPLTPTAAMAPAPAVSSTVVQRSPDRPRAPLSRGQRLALAAGAGARVLAAGLALFAELRDSGSFDHIVLNLPQGGDKTGAHQTGGPLDQPPTAPLPAGSAQPSAAVANGADARAMPPATPAVPPAGQDAVNGSALPPTPGARTAAEAPATRAQAPVATGLANPDGSATYKLQIQPWGIVYVDGIDRGVSPPIKRLTVPPGKHSIRISNPNFQDRVLDMDSANGSGQIGVDFNDGAR